MRIRRGSPDEEPRLREIALEAKAHWGYERERVETWAYGDAFSAESLRGRELAVAELDGRAVGWASLIPRGEVGWLEDLWVEPGAMGHGIGRRLFDEVAARARELGAAGLEWEADPNAAGFYERMGAQHVRDSEPSEWGRILPVLGVELGSA